MSDFSFNSDTIVAIATPLAKAGVGIIRISGAAACDIAMQLCPDLASVKPRYVHFVKMAYKGVALDEGCFIYFKGPNSYTGEDVVEIQLHSNPSLLRKVIDICVAEGARLAGKGEFTRRAFLSGKISLDQAESVIDLIDADSFQAQQVALSRHKGKLYGVITVFRAQLMAALEQMEGSIDFPEEVESISKADLKCTLDKIRTQISTILKIQDYGSVLTAGVSCVIVGRPNVGKSSFMNQLLGEERAIVSDVAGTTRDYIDDVIELGGISFRFTDTAGIRQQTKDAIEQAGIARVERFIADSDLIVWVVDAAMPLTPDDLTILKRLAPYPHVWVVLNKCDRDSVVDKTDFKVDQLFNVSCETSAGISEFKEALLTHFSEKFEGLDMSLICNARQVSVLNLVEKILENLDNNLYSGLEDDVLSIDVRAAVDALGELTGDALNEAVLDGIFSRFCVGK